MFYKVDKTVEVVHNSDAETELAETTLGEDGLKTNEKPIEQVFFDESGRKYKIVAKTREIPRKTYLLGTITGKYWGELDELKEQVYENEKFYDFNIYEAEVKVLEKDGIATTPFVFKPDAIFPKEKLPKTIPCTIAIKGHTREYDVVLHEPQLRKVTFNRRLHQEEGQEVFGTVHADITGYILDIRTEEYNEREYVVENTKSSLPAPEKEAKNTKTTVPTGNTEYRDGYKRTEYYHSNYKEAYWSNWSYTKPLGTTTEEGCFSSVAGILGTVIGAIFLILLLPRLLVVLPFILLIVLFRLIPSTAWYWLLRVLGILLLWLFIISVIGALIHYNQRYTPTPVVQDSPEENKPQFVPVVDTSTTNQQPDTLISHYRSWKDYDGNQYDGKFWVRKSAYINAGNFKNNLIVSENTQGAYDKMIYSLKENDKNNLNGLYQLFDKIKAAKNLDALVFSTMIVSFVQDIPYTVVLPNACNANLYADEFIKNYLATKDARCDGFEKFGINTPVEFMATLQGDCDTRTLLLYTILSHYNFDVALLSSEYYNHSLIAINLPFDGRAFNYGTERYVVWETTSAGIKAGILPNEVSNLNYWRISLKSK